MVISDYAGGRYAVRFSASVDGKCVELEEYHATRHERMSSEPEADATPRHRSGRTNGRQLNGSRCALRQLERRRTKPKRAIPTLLWSLRLFGKRTRALQVERNYLYDFAAVGYFMFNQVGVLTTANITGAETDEHESWRLDLLGGQVADLNIHRALYPFDAVISVGAKGWKEAGVRDCFQPLRNKEDSQRALSRLRHPSGNIQ